MNMFRVRFLDVAGKAEEIGASEAAIKTAMLDGEIEVYVYYRGPARGTQEEYLPEWSEEFEDAEWEDRGSAYDADGTYDHGTNHFATRGSAQRPSCPRYIVWGWVRVSADFVAEVLTKRKEVSLTGWWIGVERNDGALVRLRADSKESPFDLRVRGNEFLVAYEDFRFKPSTEPLERAVPDDPRRMKSLLRVIRALEVMAKLPGRGAATSIEHQLQELGFRGPNDETIRKILDEARSLQPDKG